VIEQHKDSQIRRITQIAKRLKFLVPSGKSLPENEWRKRHRFLVGLTWFHALIIILIGLLLNYRWELSVNAIFDESAVLHVVFEGLVVALLAFGAGRFSGSRSLNATLVGFGLMS